MATDIAQIEYSNDTQEWRLFSPNRDKAIILPTEWTSVLIAKDLDYVNLILGSWGYVAAGDWDRESTDWVVAVQRRRG